LGRRISPLDQRLDGILVNSTDAEDAAGLENILERYPPGRAWWGSALPDKGAGLRLVEALQDRQVPLHALAAGDVITIGAQPRLEVIAAAPEGSALLLTWDNFKVLIPGGVSPGRLKEEDLANLSLLVLEPRDLEETIQEQWLAYRPQAIIFTQGEGELELSGLNWLNTLPGRWYQVTTDGTRLWVERKR
jgi:hypothetical protein